MLARTNPDGRNADRARNLFRSFLGNDFQNNRKGAGFFHSVRIGN